ncbi:MAG: hypothetical protein AUG08_04260 [Acidobacteria bacterium 13_1_20CM_2_55_15]|nr:MAG: hypothetical protein AUG08_04260 [Acidobacteria bacterium 13_1_20CM_2_55_15]
MTGFNRKYFWRRKRLETGEGYRTDSPYKNGLVGILEHPSLIIIAMVPCQHIILQNRFGLGTDMRPEKPARFALRDFLSKFMQLAVDMATSA